MVHFRVKAAQVRNSTPKILVIERVKGWPDQMVFLVSPAPSYSSFNVKSCQKVAGGIGGVALKAKLLRLDGLG